jgi:LPXTG-site transpeptidase (sortase) family protein
VKYVLRFFCVLTLLGVSLLSVSAGSMASGAATFTTSRFEAITPVQVLDTRKTQDVLAKRKTPLRITGISGIPKTATAVVVTVTVYKASSDGLLAVYPWGQKSAPVPQVNIQKGIYPLSRTLTVSVGSSGRLGLLSTIDTDVSVDVNGFYSPATSSSAGRFVALTPQRILDARSSDSFSKKEVRRISLPRTIPQDAVGVVLNVTSYKSLKPKGKSTYWTVYAAGAKRPGVPSLSVAYSGQTVSQQVIVQRGSQGLDIFSSVGGGVLVDLVGYYTGSSAERSGVGLYVPVSSTRIVDTKSFFNTLGHNVALHSSWTTAIKPWDFLGVKRTNVGAVALNVAMVDTQNSGALTAYPSRTSRPVRSLLSSDYPGQTIGNSAHIAVSKYGVAFYTKTTTDLAVEVVGWFVGVNLNASLLAPVNPRVMARNFRAILSIPAMGLTTRVLDGTENVNKDPSRYIGSSTPNSPGNVAIFGHRVSYGREFYSLNRLKIGSVIYLLFDKKVYTYSVTEVKIKSPNDKSLWQLKSQNQTLTLVACHPLHSVAQRIVATAELRSVEESFG